MATTFAAPSTKRVDNGKLWQTAGIVAAISVVVNLIIRVLAVTLFPIPAEFLPLGWGAPVIVTIIGVIGAALVFMLIGRVSKTPSATYRLVATIALIVTLIPDVLMLFGQGMPMAGATPQGALALILMHIAPYLLAVQLFPSRALVK